jgi:hypothetical protein
MITGLLIFGIAGMAISLTTSFSIALGLRVLQVVCAALVFPIIFSTVREL